MMTSEEILEELAAQTDSIREFAGATFEVLEGYWAIADARLSAFSSDEMWAVAIEVAGYSYGADTYSLHVYLFGNCVQRDEFYMPDFAHDLLTVPSDWNQRTEDLQWGIARNGFALEWRDKRFDFAPNLDDLGAAGIELSRREIESGELTPPQMLRFVCEKLKHPFFLSEVELRDLLDDRAWSESDEAIELSTQLELVLQTRDWIHPKSGGAGIVDDEWEISPREAFATLAETLATRDLSVWNAQDKTRFNSHWRNWAEIEVEDERAQAEEIAAAKTKFRSQIELISAQKRIGLLAHIRFGIEEAPSLLDWSQQNLIECDGVEIRIFRELLPQVEAMIAEIQAPNRTANS